MTGPSTVVRHAGRDDRHAANGPSVFILGMQKCGTTTLADVLRAHPRIFVPSIKETYFFCDDDLYARGTAWYADEFYATRKAREAMFRVDATPFYLVSDEALDRIAGYAGNDARFIVILRDPVKRAYSAYWHQKRLGNEPLSFARALEAEPSRVAEARARGARWWRHAYVDAGMYGRHLRRALEVLGRDRFLVLTDQALANTPRCARRLSGHLGLPEPLQWGTTHANPAGMPRWRWLQDLVTRPGALKRMARRFVPRESRTAFGRRLLGMNVRAVRYPPMSADDAQRLGRVFADDIAVLRSLDIIEPWCATALDDWAAGPSRVADDTPP